MHSIWSDSFEAALKRQELNDQAYSMRNAYRPTEMWKLEVVFLAGLFYYNNFSQVYLVKWQINVGILPTSSIKSVTVNQK